MPQPLSLALSSTVRPRRVGRDRRGVNTVRQSASGGVRVREVAPLRIARTTAIHEAQVGELEHLAAVVPQLATEGRPQERADGEGATVIEERQAERMIVLVGETEEEGRT